LSLTQSLTSGSKYRKNEQARIALIKAASWLVQSGIQEQMGNSSGAFYTGFDSVQRSHIHPSSLSTACSIITLLYLDRLLPGGYRDMLADSAASWLVDECWDPDNGGFYSYFYPDGSNSETITVNDTSKVLQAFVCIFRDIENTYYLTAANNAYLFVKDSIEENNGDKLLLSENKWIWHSNNHRSLSQSKSVIGTLSLYEFTENESIRNLSNSILDKTIVEIEILANSQETINPETISYTLDAVDSLLVGAVSLENQRMLDHAYKGWSIVAKRLKEEGGWSSKVQAQYVRDGYLLESLGMLPEVYSLEIENTLEELLKKTIDTPDIHQYGAIADTIDNGKVLASCVSTCYVVQALSLADGFANAEDALLKDKLII